MPVSAPPGRARRRPPPWTLLALLAVLASGSGRVGAVLAAEASAAHQHGGVRLDIAIDDQALVIEIEAPLDSLLGFERAPRSAAERQAAQALLARFQQADMLFKPEAAAACTAVSAEARAAVLEPRAQASGDHADLDGRYIWHCRQPDALRSVDLGGLLDAHPRIQRLEVQVASPAGQFKPAVTRAQRVVRWGR